MRNRAIFSRATLCGLSILVALGLGLGCSDGEEGGAAGAGTGGTGGDAGKCPALTFVFPENGATLAIADDKDGDCGNGLQIDVTVATAAAQGTKATLRSNGQKISSAVATDSLFKFSDVQLASAGAAKLVVELDDDASCTAEVDLSATCSDAACELTKPALSANHPKLNGVPVAEGGDRVSAPGQDYQVGVEVKTSIEDGQPVSLTVDAKAQVAVALAQGGVAKFSGVTLVPDGDHTVFASCSPKAGATGTSAKVTFPVDTTPPDLTNAIPTDDTFIGPSGDVNLAKPDLQFNVCAETTAKDALDLPASLGPAQDNFCVAIGTASPKCAPAKSGAVGGKDGACVEIDCPGGLAFDLSVTLKDDAGNPATKTLKGIRCASSLPSVQIVEPVDGTGADISKHILAASAPQARKDQDATKAGAQYTVSACSSVAGTATLRAGQAGGGLLPVAGQVNVNTAPAQSGDNCPSGFGHVVKFLAADLPESAMSTDGKATLVTPTELEVEITEPSSAKGKSPSVKVWIDSSAPQIYSWVPADLCGKNFQSTTDLSQNVVFGSTNSAVSLVVTSNGTPATYPETGWTAGFSSFGTVTLKVGTNDVVATVSEPSGNTGALKSPCVASVGNPPIVSWTSPTQSSPLNVSTDASAATSGWQGALSVQTDLGGTGATVTFSVICGGTETTLGTVAVAGSGTASLASATIPDCASATLKATTSAVAGKGIGSASLSNKVVDTSPPSAPSGLSAKVTKRRATTFTLSWTAPSDGGASVAGYDVRVSTAPITAGNFAAAESVVFTGAPKSPGQSESLDVNSRMIETEYYFAVAGVDPGGNRSGINATATPEKAVFNQTVLSGVTDDRFGFRVDGSASINGDALSDLLVSTALTGKAYVYFGASTGYSSSPSVTFSGAVGSFFGGAATPIGDIDGDGLVDIAIGASAASGNVYVYKGRPSWASSYTHAQADYVITTDPVAEPKFATSNFGRYIAPLGDFDGDGADDFAIGAYFYGSAGARQGYVAVIRGVPAGQTFPTIVSLPSAAGTRAVAYEGEANSQFGYAITSLGPLYAGTKGAMVVGAPTTGKLYAFEGGSGASGTIQASSAKESYAGSTAMRTGNSVYNAGSGVLAVGSPGSATNAGGYAQLFFGNGLSALGAGSGTFVNSAATALGDRFGNAVFGSAFSSLTTTVSWIGGTGADIAMSSVAEGGGPAKLYLAQASKLSAGGGNIVGLADVVMPLPAGWLGSSSSSSAIRDCDGDGYADIAVGEHLVTGTPYDGRVLVLW